MSSQLLLCQDVPHVIYLLWNQRERRSNVVDGKSSEEVESARTKKNWVLRLLRTAWRSHTKMSRSLFEFHAYLSGVLKSSSMKPGGVSFSFLFHAKKQHNSNGIPKRRMFARMMHWSDTRNLRVTKGEQFLHVCVLVVIYSDHARPKNLKLLSDFLDQKHSGEDAKLRSYKQIKYFLRPYHMCSTTCKVVIFKILEATSWAAASCVTFLGQDQDVNQLLRSLPSHVLHVQERFFVFLSFSVRKTNLCLEKLLSCQTRKLVQLPETQN